MTSGRKTRTAQRVLYPAPDTTTSPLYVRPHKGEVMWDRSSLRLAPHSAVSLATYFAAFPAGLWMRKTGTRVVSLAGALDGSALIRVWVRSSTGLRTPVEATRAGRFEEEIPLSAGDEWVWVEIESGDGDAAVRDLTWELDEAEMGSTAVCITTYDRPLDCVHLLEALAGDDVLLSVVDHVIVVDQGQRRVRDEPGFAEAEASLQGRLRLIEQPNLGGSGGFSRGMIEATSAGADHAVLLDDDVRLEPESVRRMISLAARADRPVIVGAHMLDLLHPARLHSWGERVDPARFEWSPATEGLHDLDLGERDVTELPADERVDFNGWWMCLIPTSAVSDLGAALPYFIKWDDTEFSLRAADAGVDTVTMPGAALWHLPWTGKDDGLDWQAYYQLRNRIVTALLHARTRRGGTLLRATFALDVNHVLCMQYGSAAARRLALRDVLRGPHHLEETLATRTPEVRDLMAKARQIVVARESLPAPRSLSSVSPPAGPASALSRLLRVLVHQCRCAPATDNAFVDRSLTRSAGKWWVLGLLDSATVESATGRGAFVARRDRGTAVALVRDAIALRARLWMAWPALARAYREAAPALASADAWERRFAAPAQARR